MATAQMAALTLRLALSEHSLRALGLAILACIGSEG